MKLSCSFKLHAVITVRSQSFLYEVVEGVRSSLGFLTREVNVQTSVDDNELEISLSLLSLLFFCNLESLRWRANAVLNIEIKIGNI